MKLLVCCAESSGRVGTGAHRRHPDDVYAKIFQIIDLADDAADVSQSVPIGILEAGWVDLVNDTFLPPELLSTVCHGLRGYSVVCVVTWSADLSGSA